MKFVGKNVMNVRNTIFQTIAFVKLSKWNSLDPNSQILMDGVEVNFLAPIDEGDKLQKIEQGTSEEDIPKSGKRALIMLADEDTMLPRVIIRNSKFNLLENPVSSPNVLFTSYEFLFRIFWMPEKNLMSKNGFITSADGLILSGNVFKFNHLSSPASSSPKIFVKPNIAFSPLPKL